MKKTRKPSAKGVLLVKRRGHTEQFDERKMYASIYSACASAHVNHREAENIANAVSAKVLGWLKSRKQVSVDAIFKQVASALRQKSPDAAFMYETHRDIC